MEKWWRQNRIEYNTCISMASEGGTYHVYNLLPWFVSTYLQHINKNMLKQVNIVSSKKKERKRETDEDKDSERAR